jgi:hypothetical protein
MAKYRRKDQFWRHLLDLDGSPERIADHDVDRDNCPYNEQGEKEKN